MTIQAYIPLALMLENDPAAMFSAIGQFVLVTLIAFVVMALIASHLRFRALVQGESTEGDERIDGLAPLERELARRLARSGGRGGAFVLLSLAANRPPDEWHAPWRAGLRADDDVFVQDDGLMVLLDLEAVDLAGVIERGIAACRAADAPANRVSEWHVGWAAYPETSRDAPALMARAQERKPWAGGEAAGLPAKPEENPREHAMLTGNALRMSAQRTVSAYRKEHKPVSVLYIDVARMDYFNDYYGRDAGNAVLEGVTRVLQDEFREDDLIGRDEGVFLVVMACGVQGAETAARRLVRRLKRETFVFDTHALRPSVRIGVAAYPEHGYLPRHLMTSAYKALQEAKEAGENVCLTYDESMSAHEADRRFVDTL